MNGNHRDILASSQEAPSPPPLHTGSSRPPGTGQALSPAIPTWLCYQARHSSYLSFSAWRGQHSPLWRKSLVHLGFTFTYGVEGLSRSRPQQSILGAHLLSIVHSYYVVFGHDGGSHTGLSITWISLVLRWFWVEVGFEDQGAWNLAHSTFFSICYPFIYSRIFFLEVLFFIYMYVHSCAKMVLFYLW